jgi:S1-C subfamily serine protease
MSSYNPYSYRQTPPPRVSWLPLILLVFLGVALGALLLTKGLGWRLWPQKNPEVTVSAEARPVAARGSLSEFEQMTIDIYNKNAPAVVHVSNLTQRGSFLGLNEQEVVQGTGSGFVWDVGEDGSGIIVTNTHVVEGASSVVVILNDKERSSYQTDYWVTYPDKDLAVLYVKAPKDKLHKIPMIGQSSNLKVGQQTFAIGNPFGLDQTLTTGIVSALGRQITSVTNKPIQGVIQTSAAINPGNSGGPLLDSAGRLIGVNTAILSPSGTFAGIGFAIPVDEVNQVVPQLIAKLKQTMQTNQRHAEVSPPRLGVSLVPDQVAQDLGVDEGALIYKVAPNSPAAKAGLRGTSQNLRTGRIQLGDVIVAIDGEPVKSTKDVHRILGQHKAGDELTLSVERNGQKRDVKVTLAALPQ